MRPTTIHLPAPCHESWAAMTPTAVGRHCAACQTQVVDFTHLTDGEVVAFLRQHPSVSCGRFRESQLSRPLLPAAQPVAGWRRWLGATLALLGLGAGLEAHAQVSTGPEAVYNGGPTPRGASQRGAAPVEVALPADTLAGPVASEAAATTLIQGIVYDLHGATAPGVKVWLRSADQELLATTDAKGRFQFSVAADSVRGYLSVSRSPALGFYRQGASAEVIGASPQPYQLHLTRRRLKWQRIHSGKFR